MKRRPRKPRPDSTDEPEEKPAKTVRITRTRPLTDGYLDPWNGELDDDEEDFDALPELD